MVDVLLAVTVSVEAADWSSPASLSSPKQTL